MTRRPDPRSDEGTILVLVLGFTAVLLMLVAVVVNVSSVILAKRSLASAADGAAVSAAQALDVGAVYDDGLGERIPLDGQLARERVEQYRLQSLAGQPGLFLDVELSQDRTTAIVHAERSVVLPFGRLFDFRPVVVRAEARARAPVRP